MAVGAVLAILVALIAGGAWYYFTAHSSQNSFSENNPHPTPDLYQATGVSDADNQFALDLFERYAGEKNANDNIFFSPFSISSAMAMVYEGAKGKTAQEIADVFHFPADINQLRSGYQSAFGLINGTSSDYKLTTANALWVQKDYQLLSGYTDAIKNYYGGSIAALDFVGNAAQAVSTVNQWVADRTNNKIQNILSPGSVDAHTRLILTNAIYFKGAWTNAFEQAATLNKDFTLGDGTHTQIPIMEQVTDFPYADVGDAQFVELPYGQSENVSMYVLLPKGNNLSALENELTAQKITGWEKELKSNQVDISLPKFHIETQADMPQDLAAMGMPTAFSSINADFSGMATIKDPSQNLYISDVIHKAFIDTDENGTEAAAATAVVVSTAQAIGPQPAQPPVIFNANHPFVFFIQDNQTGDILFFGRVSAPAVQ
jgi:serpin B